MDRILGSKTSTTAPLGSGSTRLILQVRIVRRIVPLLLGLTAFACKGDQVELTEASAESGIAVDVVSAPWLDSLSNDSPIFVGLTSTHAAGVIQGAPQVTLVSRSTGKVTRLQRQGAGPGEMRGPSAVWFAGESLLVNDRSLGRVIAFSLDGVHLVSYPVVSTGTSVAGGPSGFLLAPSSSGPALARLYHLGSVDSGIPLGRRTAVRVRRSKDLVAYGGRGRVFLYEGSTGLVSVVDTNGSAMMEPTSIPRWLDTALRTQFSEMIASTKDKGPRITEDAPLAKFMVGDGRGRVLLFYVLRDRRDLGYAVRYDPEAQSFSRLRFPADSVSAEILWRAASAAMSDSLLVAGSSDGVTAVVVGP
jgi:hypothetical protein